MSAPAGTGPGPWRPRRVRAGGWEVVALSDGTLRLDGGSMWGVVPRTMWAEWTPPADDNTIPLALRPFLARKDDLVVVIEPGIGDRWSPKWRRIYAIERADTLASTLAACGVAPEDVTHVVASHCHFDHVGGAVVERGGALAPRFPRARHLAPRVEVEVALDPDPLRRPSYRPDDVAPLAAAGLLETWEGDAELLPGLRAFDASGHSDGVAVLVLGDPEGDDAAIFWADVVPTTHHVQPPYVMAYDLDVPRSYASRSRWLARAAERGWTGLFYHDVDVPFARLRADGRRYAVEPVAGEPLPAPAA